MYYPVLALALICFVYHTAVHVLGHYGRLKEGMAVHMSIGTAMFVGWFSYFYASFADTMMFDVFPLNFAGLAVLAIGIYLFVVSHGKVHKRMHLGKGGLVTEGIYKKIRHPMYLGEIMMLLGAPIFAQGLMTLVLSPLFIVQILVWRHMEEEHLLKEFPGYREYMKRTWF